MEPKNIILMNRLFPGHTYDKLYLKIIGVYDEQCSMCKVVESAEHLIFKWKKFENLRKNFSFFNNFFSISDILNTMNMDLFNNLTRFIFEANLDF